MVQIDIKLCSLHQVFLNTTSCCQKLMQLQLLSPWSRSWACVAHVCPSLWTPAQGAASSHGFVWPEHGSPASLHPRCHHQSHTLQLVPSAPPLSPDIPVSTKDSILTFKGKKITE